MTSQLHSGAIAPPAKGVGAFVHVPTPGDHYSAATGSATMSLIHEIARRHQRAGGDTRVIVGHDTRHDHRAGQCIEVKFRGTIGKPQKLLDSALSRLGFSRRFEAKIYQPAFDSLEPDFDGTIFLYNCPGAVAACKKRCPEAIVCLYAVNALFRTYRQQEVCRVVDAADGVICCSEYIAGDLTRRMGRSSQKINVVHHGVDGRHFCPAVSRTEAIPTILFIGRAIPEKGPDLLIRAAVRLRHRQYKFKLRIVGSQGYAPNQSLSRFEREMRRLAAPIADRVEFQSSIPRSGLLGEYQAASIFVAPSRWDDPFPLTVLEAMASGVPTVAARRGGIPEVGDAVLYFDPPNVEQLADHLAALLDDSAARSQWARRGRARAEEFSWESHYRKLTAAVNGFA